MEVLARESLLARARLSEISMITDHMQSVIVSDDLILHTDATLQLVQNANTVMEGDTEVNAICVRLTAVVGTVLREIGVSLMAVDGTAGISYTL